MWILLSLCVNYDLYVDTIISMEYIYFFSIGRRFGVERLWRRYDNRRQSGIPIPIIIQGPILHKTFFALKVVNVLSRDPCRIGS